MKYNFLYFIKMSVLKIYIALENLGKKYNIPPDILRYILDYEKLHIMTKQNIDFIHRKIRQPQYKNGFTFHINDLPYASLGNIYEIKAHITALLKKKRPDLIFSHYCCKSVSNLPKGMMFISHDKKNKKIY